MLETYVRGGIDLVAAAKNKASDKGDFASRMLELETTLNNVKDNSDETRLNSLRELAEELVGNSSLTDALNTLSAENLTKINTLTNQLNTEINRAKGMENTISSTITDGLADLIAQLNTEITNRQNADTSVSGQLTTKHNTALSTLNSGVTEMNASDGVIQTNISSLRNADTSINNEISGIKNKNLGQDTVLYELVKDFSPDPINIPEGRQPGPEIDTSTPQAEIINNNWANGIEGLYTSRPANVDLTKYAEFTSLVDGVNYYAYLSVNPSSSGYTSSQITDELKSSLGWDANNDAVPSLALIKLIIDNNISADKDLYDSGNWSDWTVEGINEGQITNDNAFTVEGQGGKQIHMRTNGTRDSGKLRSAYIGTAVANEDTPAEETPVDNDQPQTNTDWESGVEGLYLSSNAPTSIPEGYVRFEDAEKQYAVFLKKEYGNSPQPILAKDIPTDALLPSVALISHMKQLGITRNVPWKQADGTDYSGASDLWPAEQIRYHWTKDGVQGILDGSGIVNKVWTLSWTNGKLVSDLATNSQTSGSYYFSLYTG